VRVFVKQDRHRRIARRRAHHHEVCIGPAREIAADVANRFTAAVAWLKAIERLLVLQDDDPRRDGARRDGVGKQFRKRVAKTRDLAQGSLQFAGRRIAHDDESGRHNLIPGRTARGRRRAGGGLLRRRGRNTQADQQGKTPHDWPHLTPGLE
jgi:hypothetical protein